MMQNTEYIGNILGKIPHICSFCLIGSSPSKNSPCILHELFFCAQYKRLAYGHEGLDGLYGNFYPHRGLKRPYIFLYNKITLNYDV